MRFKCNDCELGLQFETEAELKNHKRKFCTGSGYADIARLDMRKADLLNGKDDNIRMDKAGIKEYLNGDARWAQPVDEYESNIAAFASPQVDKQRRKIDGNSLLDRAENLESNLKASRLNQHLQNQDVMNLLKDLSQRKENELRAQIEKEEIQRSILNQSKKDLGSLGVAKQRELEKLHQDREAVRIREHNLLDEVGKMEAQLLKQESYMNQQRAIINDGDPMIRAAHMRTLKDKEINWAAERAGDVAKIKNQRDRLEREREGIMKELERVREDGAGSRSGFRSNGAARHAGSALAFDKPPSGYGPRQQQIEPSLQDKLVADQMKLNKLRLDQQQSKHNLLDVNDIDVLQREIDGQPRYLDGVQQLQNDYYQKQDPNQAEYLGVIRRRLETEAAGPKSNNQMNNKKDDGILGKLDDLERLLLQGEGQANKQMNIQEFPSQQMRPPQMPPQPIAPASVDLYGSMPQGLPPMNPQQQQFGYGQPTQWAPPQVGFPGQTMEFTQAGQDPAMTQLASMLQNQDTENRKLREVLENFGKNMGTQEELDDVVNNTNQQLQHLGGAAALQPFQGQIKQGDNHIHKSNRSPREDTGHSPREGTHQTVFPDEFLFRQNEERSADLEVEERALMNLAAQEYDQLRVIQRLPKNSDLYAYKLQQYKELSAMRAEVEKVLQEQRLEKIKRDFERQKIDEERQLRHQQWLEHQKRQILEGRIGADGGSPSPQKQYVNYQPVMQPKPYHHSEDSQNSSLPLPAAQISANAPIQQVRQQQSYDNIQNDVIAALVQLDYAFALPRQVRQLKAVFSAFTAQGATGQPGLSGPSAAEAETYNQNLNKVFLGTRQLFNQIPIGQESRIIFELQAVDQAQPSGFAGVGWTWVDLFRGNEKQIWTGRWLLPIYAGATRPELTSTGGVNLEQAPGINLCLRLGPPGDQIFEGRANHLTVQNDYTIHPNHIAGLKQPAAIDRQQSLVSKQPSQIQKQPTIKRPTRDPRYRCKGVRIRFHFAQHMQHYEKLTLRVSLYEGETNLATQANGEVCEAQAPSIPDNTAIPAVRGSSVSVEPNGQVKVDVGVGGPERQLKTDAVIRPLNNFEFVWEKDFFNQFWDNNRQLPLILVIEVFGRPKGTQGSRQVVSYATFEILDSEDGKVRYGQHVVPLCKPPIAFLANERVELQNETILFSLLDPTLHKQSLAAGGLSQSIVAPQESALMAQPSLRPQSPAPSEMSEQFLPNFEKQYTMSEKWLPNNGLDIYIDGTRHLPDNTSMAKLTIRVVDSDLNNLIPQEIIFPDIETSSTRNQRFNFQTELRLKKTKPTALVYMMFETVDISHNQPRLVGYSYFPLFIDARQGMPAATDSATDISPHVGLYQMPIFWARVREETPFTYERFVYLERVPTASVLVRITKAPVDASGKAVSTKNLPIAERWNQLVKAPTYGEGVYSTQYFQCSDDEKQVMSLRRKRPDAPMDVAVARLLQSQGKDGAQLTVQQKMKFLTELIKTNKKSALIDLDYHAQYEPVLGVRINVEAIHDNKEKGLLAVLASITPPASYYDDNKPDQLADAFAFSELDFNSTQATQKFNEGDASVLGFKPQQPGMSVLFDIKIYSPEKDSFSDYGFALAPLLQGLDTDADSGNLEFYVNSGIFTLPVYKGKISDAAVKKLRDTLEPLKLIADMLARKEIEYLQTVSLIAKIVDSQRKLHFRESYEKRAPNTRFVDPKLVSKYAFKPITGGIFGGAPKKLIEQVPAEKRKDLPGFIKSLSDKFNLFMKI